jgi:hypothetical protein
MTNPIARRLPGHRPGNRLSCPGGEPVSQPTLIKRLTGAGDQSGDSGAAGDRPEPPSLCV